MIVLRVKIDEDFFEIEIKECSFVGHYTNIEEVKKMLLKHIEYEFNKEINRLLINSTNEGLEN